MFTFAVEVLLIDLIICVLSQLLDMLKFYTGFEINDQTGNALTENEMTTIHYDRITSLQVKCLQEERDVVLLLKLLYIQIRVFPKACCLLFIFIIRSSCNLTLYVIWKVLISGCDCNKIMHSSKKNTTFEIKVNCSFKIYLEGNLILLCSRWHHFIKTSTCIVIVVLCT